MAEKPYNSLEHSIVQGLIRNEPHHDYEATDFHEALLFAIAREIGRVHWNHYQTSWDRWSDDPHIPGIQWRRYLYDCDCPETRDGFVPKHLETCRLTQPNFGFEDVEITWYKNPGRGMSINQDWPPDKWMAWFDRCLAKIREFDRKDGATERYLHPMPQSGHIHSARIHMCWLTDWKDYRAVVDEDIKVLTERITDADDESEERMSEDWARIIPRDVSADEAKRLSIAFACGVVAEKERAIDEDRPRTTGDSHND